MRNCGECLFNDVEVVQLDPATGVCPRCGADYGPPRDDDQALVCWDCGTPIVRHADGAEKPCGHPGTMVTSRAEYLRRRRPGAQNGGATDQQTTENPSKSSESTSATVAPPRAGQERGKN